LIAKTKIASLRETLSTRVRQTFRYRINFNHIAKADLAEMKEWCEEKCNGLWRCESYHALYFQFEDDHDAIMFNLKFGAKGK
jgi:hypothetical protein